jgi:hypothetical protein
MDFDLGDVGEFINENPQIPLAAGLMAGAAVRKNTEKARQEAAEITGRLARIERQAEQARQEAKREATSLAQDKDLAFEISQQLENLASFGTPVAALERLRDYSRDLRGRNINPGRFDSFEDKIFVKGILEKIALLDKELVIQCEELRSAQVRSDASSLSDNIKSIPLQYAPAISYLRLELLAENLCVLSSRVDKTKGISTRGLFAQCKQQLSEALNESFAAIPSETMEDLSKLKSWVHLSRLVEILDHAGRKIARLRNELSTVPPPPQNRTRMELAMQVPSIFYSIVGILLLSVVAGLSGLFALAFVSQGWMAIGLLATLGAMAIGNYATPLARHKNLEAERAQAQRDHELAIKSISAKLEAEQCNYAQQESVARKLRFIEEDSLEYALSLECGSEEMSAFKKSAKAYCEDVSKALELDHELLAALLDSDRIAF